MKLISSLELLKDVSQVDNMKFKTKNSFAKDESTHCKNLIIIVKGGKNQLKLSLENHSDL